MRTYCENFLPKELADKLQLDHLKRVPDTFVDRKLRAHFSDMVYRCPFGSSGNEVLLTLLFEHKSYMPKFPHLQLLRYMMNAWENEVKKIKEKKDQSQFLLTPIIPIIIYHGKLTWKVRPFKDYFHATQDSALARFVPEFPYLLTDVEDYPPEMVQQMDWGWLGALMMAFLLSKDEEKSETYFELIWHYLYEKTEQRLDLRSEFFVYFVKTLKVKPQKIQQMITQLPPSLRKKDLTTFEQMIAQAGEKWLAEHGEDFVARAEMEKRIIQEKERAEKQMQEKERLIQSEKKEKELLRKATIKAGLKVNLSIETLMEMTSLSRKAVQKLIEQVEAEEKGSIDTKE